MTLNSNEIWYEGMKILTTELCSLLRSFRKKGTEMGHEIFNLTNDVIKIVSKK